ncbi:hypothetical protein [Skermanella stibiiresistens]|nr:hypothetical protein [Skermanella stibiiresistens]
MVSRRSFVAMAPAAAVAISAPCVAAAPDDTRLIDLCRQHVALDPVITGLWDRHIQVRNDTIATIGECPKSGPGVGEWQDRYCHTPAWHSETDHDDVAESQCRLMNEIIYTEAHTTAGVAAKLDLWRRTDHRFMSGNDGLWESIADDLERMTGMRIAEAVEHDH